MLYIFFIQFAERKFFGRYHRFSRVFLAGKNYLRVGCLSAAESCHVATLQTNVGCCSGVEQRPVKITGNTAVVGLFGFEKKASLGKQKTAVFRNGCACPYVGAGGTAAAASGRKG